MAQLSRLDAVLRLRGLTGWEPDTTLFDSQSPQRRRGGGPRALGGGKTLVVGVGRGDVLEEDLARNRLTWAIALNESSFRKAAGAASLRVALGPTPTATSTPGTSLPASGPPSRASRPSSASAHGRSQHGQRSIGSASVPMHRRSAGAGAVTEDETSEVVPPWRPPPPQPSLCEGAEQRVHAVVPVGAKYSAQARRCCAACL